MEEKKPFYLSKTFWANLLMAGLAAYPPIGDLFQQNPEYMGYLFAGVNLVLRLVTKKQISIS